MKFLVDECSGPALALWLKENDYDVISVFDEMRGASDDSVLKRAFDEERVLITNDKDFGEMIVRQKKPHCGIILIRLSDERLQNKILAMKLVLRDYSHEIIGNFVVVSEKVVRIIQLRN